MTAPLTHQTIAQRFSAAAPMYEPLAQIQLHVVEQLAAWLPETTPAYILDAGCGTGLLTRKLVSTYPTSRIDAVDISRAMLHQAQSIIHHDPIQWIQHSISTFTSEQPYDLIASSSALHWMDPFSDGLRHLLTNLAHDGYFVCALMLTDTLKELHEARHRIAPAKKPQGQLPELETITQILQEQDLQLELCIAKELTERYPDGTTFLRAIHNMGLTGGRVSRSRNPLNRKELAALAQYYDTHFQHKEGGVYATYQVAFIKGRKK